MGGSFSRVVLLALKVALLSSIACSPGETHRSDPGNRPNRQPPRWTEARRPVWAGTGDRSPAWRVECSGSGFWPRCSLLEGPDVNAVRGTIARRDPPRDEGFTRSLWTESLWSAHELSWADRRTIEKLIEDNRTVIWVFREDPASDDRVADPRQTLFYARCATGEQPEIVHGVAHGAATLAYFYRRRGRCGHCGRA